jgi:serine/threonine-protein kinase RsbW
MKKIRIEIPSLSENIRMIESFIDNAKEKYHLNDDIYGNIMIAVTEAVNNAIKHGNQNNSGKNVSLALAFEEGVIKFRVEDEGNGFDYEHLPDPTDPVNIEKISGRGVFLMRNLADKVEFSNNGATVEMVFKMAS